MAEAEFDTHELDELTRAMFRTAEEKYPAEAKKFLMKQGNEQRKLYRHQVRAKTNKVTNKLYGGIDRGRVHKYQEDFQVRVYNKAPHAYLIEHGHKNVKTRAGKGSIPVGTPIVMVPGRSGPLFIGRSGAEKTIEGKHLAADATNEMKAKFPVAVEAFVDDLMREGLEM